MQLLYFFEKMRMPWLDRVMLVFTEFGGEMLFIALAIVALWCVSKRAGYYMLSVGLVGTVLNQFLKLAFRISRPWVQDSEFTIVEAARADAGGYSFPSGHTQNAAASLIAPALLTKKKWLKIVLIAVYVLVAVSRMYLGVHTPLDVGVSIVVGLALVFLMRPLFKEENVPSRRMYTILFVMAGLAGMYMLYVHLWPFPADIELDNLAEGTKTAYMLFFAVLGMIVAYWMDQKFVHFTVDGSIPAQIVKAVLGLALTMGVRALLKAPLNALFNGAPIANGIRYFCMVVFAAGVWPMSFPFICRLLPKK